MSTELPELLCRVNFPLYQATMITPRHLVGNLRVAAAGRGRDECGGGLAVDLAARPRHGLDKPLLVLVRHLVKPGTSRFYRTPRA